MLGVPDLKLIVNFLKQHNILLIVLLHSSPGIEVAAHTLLPETKAFVSDLAANIQKVTQVIELVTIQFEHGAGNL